MAGAAEPVVEVVGLRKDFGERQAVRGIDFRIHAGECVGLLGPNGAGKTTTIHVLLGLVRKTAGEVRVFGMPVPSRLRHIKLRTGVTPQADNLDPDLTVLENLLTYAAYFDVPARTARGRAEELLDFFALDGYRDEIIQHLSGGQRRRLLLARALINAPDLVILDEPTIGLDPQARHLIWDRLDALRARGTPMLLTSHYMEEVERLSSRVLIMDHGRIVARGEPRQMVRDLLGQEVVEVTGTEAELDGLLAAIAPCDVTTERLPGRLFVFTRAACPELEARIRPMKHWVRRPAGLEDLFIHLTGRTLRETA
nr:ATP-binding cassette domain-containing protein [Dissulfurirhabdus thermomarina]